MSAWGELKRLLNKEKEITENRLLNTICITHIVSYKKFREYLHILVDIEYIGHWRGHFSKYDSVNVPHYKLYKKIPEKLTINDAKKMKQMPWLEWFKYSE